MQRIILDGETGSDGLVWAIRICKLPGVRRSTRRDQIITAGADIGGRHPDSQRWVPCHATHAPNIRCKLVWRCDIDSRAHATPACHKHVSGKPTVILKRFKLVRWRSQPARNAILAISHHGARRRHVEAYARHASDKESTSPSRLRPVQSSKSRCMYLGKDGFYRAILSADGHMVRCIETSMQAVQVAWRKMHLRDPVCRRDQAEGSST